MLHEPLFFGLSLLTANEEALLSAFHAWHAVIATIMSLISWGIYLEANKKNKAQKRNERTHRQLFYWGWACTIWILYYILKTKSIIGLNSADHVGVVLDSTLSIVNSLAILFCALCLSTHARVPSTQILAGAAICIAFVIGGFLFVQPGTVDPEGVMFVITWPAAILAAFVLVLLYHNLVRRLEDAHRRTRAVALTLFVGYAFVQTEYPAMYVANSCKYAYAAPLNELMYGLALGLKTLCTLFLVATRGIVNVASVDSDSSLSG